MGHALKSAIENIILEFPAPNLTLKEQNSLKHSIS